MKLQYLKNSVLGNAASVYKELKLKNRKVRIFPAHEQTKSIFIHIPKVAGFSVAKSLYGFDPWHFTMQDYAKIADVSQFYVFAFVREPAERLYSLYTYLTGLSYTAPALTRCQTSQSFRQFCDEWQAGQATGKHPFFKSQIDFLQLDGAKIGVNFVGRLENVDADYATIREHLHLPPSPLPHYNKSKPASAITAQDRSYCQTFLADEYEILRY